MIDLQVGLNEHETISRLFYSKREARRKASTFAIILQEQMEMS